MANVLNVYDKYSSEDYLCHKLKPVDITQYMCSHCDCDVDAEDINKVYCDKCGEFLYVTEK